VCGHGLKKRKKIKLEDVLKILYYL